MREIRQCAELVHFTVPWNVKDNLNLLKLSFYHYQNEGVISETSITSFSINGSNHEIIKMFPIVVQCYDAL